MRRNSIDMKGLASTSSSLTRNVALRSSSSSDECTKATKVDDTLLPVAVNSFLPPPSTQQHQQQHNPPTRFLGGHRTRGRSERASSAMSCSSPHVSDGNGDGKDEEQPQQQKVQELLPEMGSPLDGGMTHPANRRDRSEERKRMKDAKAARAQAYEERWNQKCAQETSEGMTFSGWKQPIGNAEYGGWMYPVAKVSHQESVDMNAELGWKRSLHPAGVREERDYRGWDRPASSSSSSGKEDLGGWLFPLAQVDRILDDYQAEVEILGKKGFVLSLLVWFLCVEIEVLAHILYNKLLESSHYEAETEDKDPLSGTDAEVSGDVLERGFFHADRLLWMAPGPMACHHSAIAVMVTVATKGGTVEWWLDGHKDEAVWGLDIEWRPTFQKGDYHFASLLQLSLEDCCLLIQLQFIDVLPESLKNLLANSQIMMGGVGIKADTNKLRKDFNLNCAGEVELTMLAVSTLKNPALKKTGLASLTEIVLGVPYKKNKRTTMSNWENRELTYAQIQYAAADAWLSYSILVALLNHKEQPAVSHLTGLDETSITPVF